MATARSGSYSKKKGNAYECKIVKELKELFGTDDIFTARNESKRLDDAKIDIADVSGLVPCYFQLKSTQNTPSIKAINDEVGLKDKPLCILWNAQEKREKNIVSVGEYAIIPKAFFYKLLSNVATNSIGIKSDNK